MYGSPWAGANTTGHGKYEKKEINSQHDPEVTDLTGPGQRPVTSPALTIAKRLDSSCPTLPTFWEVLSSSPLWLAGLCSSFRPSAGIYLPGNLPHRRPKCPIGALCPETLKGHHCLVSPAPNSGTWATNLRSTCVWVVCTWHPIPSANQKGKSLLRSSWHAGWSL